ncbi:MAG TPA: signal peptidase I [Gaiellaceae bacterium]|jgi:signal peptidase|nr:signal peptidase I [Gaiellaceae bacterium]
MEVVMDAPASTEQDVHPGSAVWRWTRRVVGALALLAATAAILGLAAITIGPHLFAYQALVVRSGSMSPTIPTGSVVFYRPVQASDVKVGDVIVFNEPGKQDTKVTHRVYAIGTGPGGKYFQTKGDANGGPDPWHVPAVGTGWKEVWHVPVVGYVLFDIQSTYGRLLLLLVPAALLAALTLWEIWDGRRPETAT